MVGNIGYTGYYMQCPAGDGELIAHTTQGENNLVIAYSTCPACRGYWTTSFAANFIKLPPEDFQTTRADKPDYSNDGEAKFKCPVCQFALQRATGTNIPDDIWVYSCPEGHGYFFPRGQLAQFKKAQSVKIAYHKLWKLPLPNVSSVLLAGLLTLILTGGLVAGLRALPNRQTTTSNASQILLSEHAYVSADTHEVLFSVQTQQESTLTVHITSFNNFQEPLQSDDKRRHALTVKDIPPGSYEYYYMISVKNENLKSEEYTFVIP